MKNQNMTNRFTTVLFALGFSALLPIAQAVVPAPDGGYPGGNTAEGTSALLSSSTGAYNTAIGIYSLLSLTDGKFCTGVGAGTLLANTGDGNTATGAGALLSNISGTGNTASGTFALFFNTDGVDNTATGFRALMSNTGVENTANGSVALQSNTTGEATQRLVRQRSSSTQRAAAIRPPVLLRSLPTRSATSTQPLVMKRS